MLRYASSRGDSSPRNTPLVMLGFHADDNCRVHEIVARVSSAFGLTATAGCANALSPWRADTATLSCADTRCCQRTPKLTKRCASLLPSSAPAAARAE